MFITFYLAAEGRSHSFKNSINVLFFYLFHFFGFLIFKDEKNLSLWNTRANRDATKVNLFYTLQRHMCICKVEWISANRIALGFMNGLVEIWKIDEEGETTINRVVKQLKCGNKYVSLGISTRLQLS